MPFLKSFSFNHHAVGDENDLSMSCSAHFCYLTFSSEVKMKVMKVKTSLRRRMVKMLLRIKRMKVKDTYKNENDKSEDIIEKENDDS